MRNIFADYWLFVSFIWVYRILGSPLPLFRGRRASPFASYKWQDACTGTGTDYPWLYNLYFRYWLNRPPVPSLKAI